MKKILFTLWLSSAVGWLHANSVLIPMDDKQQNHLKAYGIAYQLLKDEVDVDWLLNYRGGSFMVKHTQALVRECRLRGVSCEVISDSQAASIIAQVEQQEVNMGVVKLHKSAKIAVYSPSKISPAEFENTDAVLNVLTFAEIPFDVIYDAEILRGDLPQYDWLHLHHEDFTGQFGRNLHRLSAEDLRAQQDIAQRFGYAKVSQMKLAVAKKIKEFCAGGGFLFAMCSGAETFDIALSAEGVDIVETQFDGDGIDRNAQQKLDFSRSIAFHNFVLDLENEYGGMGFSSINSSLNRYGDATTHFNLFDFSAKWDMIPAMLVQNHEQVIREFFGQTTSFTKSTVKPSSLIMGESPSSVRYIYGELGNGQWVFYGGHDPEGRRGRNNWRIPTDLTLHPNSPGYRLILNNVLFPSARKKKRKT